MDYPYRWAVQWYSKNTLDGERRFFVWDWKNPQRTTPLLFRTRREAREFVKDRYGYIAGRPDLRREPHGWRMPRVVKVKIDISIWNTWPRPASGYETTC